ncbi:MAG: histidine triad nucleotide-binding protein [Candidatus Calescibacterium sp.]|nr:histidine triad nucleotide-binding protein [Candidatus Calescibacterium sp.]MCX7971830.1 histidine triad nucleotide-binding protein [bacterium]MDW8194945.1 histidine triad nucleotide-binding protein [Candidatus Calescibacterium sp.]
MKKDCIFCKIINKEINSEIIFEDEKIIVFKDIYPRAPIHWLIVPKKHIETHMQLTDEDKEIMGHLHLVTKKVAEQNNINHYKLIMNCGYEAGQRVFHIHLHLLSGNIFGEA